MLVGFTILRVLGHGGAAVVYLARQEALARLVAVKLLRRDVHDPKAWRRFRREARTVARLSAHPNVVTVFTAGRSQAGEPFIVTEYLDRGSLGDVIAVEGALPAGAVARMGTAIADALLAAHEIGILHRDVKPDNVFLDRNGGVKLGDFGIARLLGAQRITITDVVAFTPEHVAPEILRGDPDGPWSDVYSLGSTLATAVLGHPPFTRRPDERVEALLSRKLMAPAPAMPVSLPASLTEPIARALDPDPARRPALAELRRQLAEAATSLGTPASLPPPTPGIAPVTNPTELTEVQRSTLRRRNRLRAVGVVAGALVVFALVLALLAALVSEFRGGSQTLDPLAPATTNRAVSAPATPLPTTPPTSATTTVAPTTEPPATTAQEVAPPATAATTQGSPLPRPATLEPTSTVAAPAPTSTVAAPTSTVTTPAPATPELTSTSTTPAPATPEPTPSTGVAPAPTGAVDGQSQSALLTPDGADAFIRTYYDLVRTGDYETSWSQLAPEFQRGRAHSYEYYVDFWSKNDADVGGVQLVESTPDRAVVVIDLRVNGSRTPVRDQLTLRAGPGGQPLIAREVILDS